jgi:hypothetical protein
MIFCGLVYFYNIIRNLKCVQVKVKLKSTAINEDTLFEHTSYIFVRNWAYFDMLFDYLKMVVFVPRNSGI